MISRDGTFATIGEPRCNWIFVVVRFNDRIRYRKPIVGRRSAPLSKYHEFSRCICYVKLRKFPPRRGGRAAWLPASRLRLPWLTNDWHQLLACVSWYLAAVSDELWAFVTVQTQSGGGEASSICTRAEISSPPRRGGGSRKKDEEREKEREQEKSFCGVSRLMMPPPSIFPALLSCFLSFPLPFISLILRCLPGSPSYPRLSRSRRQFFRRRCQKPALIPSPDSGKRRRRPSFLLLLLLPRRRDKSSTGESPVSPDPGLYFIAQ